MTPEAVKALAHEAAEAARDMAEGTGLMPTADDALEFIVQVHYDEGEEIIPLDDSERALFRLHYLECMAGSDQGCTLDCDCEHDCDCEEHP